MAVDAFVMPIWKFKVGDFETALERLAGRGQVNYIGGGRGGSGNLLTHWWHVRRAKSEVERIRLTVVRDSGETVHWKDEGDCAYSSQFHNGTALRSYAKWLHHRDRLPDFTMPESRDFWDHPVHKLTPGDADKSSHLINHSLYNGYFLPARFDAVVPVEPYLIYGIREAFRDAGSTHRLMDELQSIRAVCGLPDDGEFDESDPISYVRDGLAQMLKIAELSIRHGLPIVFWG